VGTTPTKVVAASNPEFLSPQLAAAMSHPTRVHVMCVLRERIASPREVAEEIGEPLNNVTYHFNQLRKLGCIELVRTDRVRGGRVTEHFYRAKRRMYFDEAAWNALSKKERLDLVGVSLRLISQDITAAMAAGTIFGDDHAHLCRTPMVVDEEGWQELTAVVERATDELLEVETRVAERVAEGARAHIPAKVEMMQFRSPARDASPRIALPTMSLTRVRSRGVRLAGLPRDFFIRDQNSDCSLAVRFCWTRSRPFWASQRVIAQTVFQGTFLQIQGTARRAIQAGMH
jgi:DNA-binding transcriptional ArsR family regulator